MVIVSRSDDLDCCLEAKHGYIILKLLVEIFPPGPG